MNGAQICLFSFRNWIKREQIKKPIDKNSTTTDTIELCHKDKKACFRLHPTV